MISRHTALLLRDELVGFARSKVMLVLWLLLPLLATLAYFFLPGGQEAGLPATAVVGLMVSSLAGTIAAVMIAVDIVSERSRGVHELFLVRPLRAEAILWAKFLAVFGCVSVACVVSIAVGVVVDLVQGVEVTSTLIRDTFASLGSAVGVIAISAATGAFVGVLTKSVLVAVILVLYVAQNLVILPMLPTFLELGDGYFWLFQAATALVTVAVMVFAGLLFRREA